MKGIKHRIFSVGIAIAMCICTLATTASAVEYKSTVTEEATCYNLELTSNGISSITGTNGNNVPLSVLSSISGYKNGTLSTDPDGIAVYVDAVGSGGMGITVKTTSSWNGYMSLDVFSYKGGSVPIEGASIYSNGERQFHDLTHGPAPVYYFFGFKGIPSGESVGVEIWIYG